MTTFSHRRGLAAAALTLTGVLALSGCASGKSTNDGGGSGSSSGAQTQIAFLDASTANTYLAASLKQMNKIAAKNNVKITTFDAGFKPGVQAGQIQTILASKKYKGIIIAALDGAAVIPQLEQAIKSGVQVAVLNQVIGTKLDTSNPQFPGAAVSVLTPPLTTGQRLGKLTTQACQGISNCGVVYFYGIKGTPIDTATRRGFKAATASSPNIKVIAEAEGKYLGPDVGLKAMQNILSRNLKVSVVVGADQPIQGVQLALKSANKKNVKLIGIGGSTPALAGVSSGTWYGDIFLAPKTEGQLALQALIKAIKTKKTSGGIDAGSTLPDSGLVTKANVSKFSAQWAG